MPWSWRHLICSRNFHGSYQGLRMVEAMAETIVNALPAAIAPHMHWFMALFSVPLLMILGTDAFYYALLPDHYRRSTAVRHHAGNGSGNLPFISHNGNSDQPVRCSSIRGPRSCRCLHQWAYPLLPAPCMAGEYCSTDLINAGWRDSVLRKKTTLSGWKAGLRWSFFTYYAKIDLILSEFFFRMKICHESFQEIGAEIREGVSTVFVTNILRGEFKSIVNIDSVPNLSGYSCILPFRWQP